MMPYDTYRLYQIERAKSPAEIRRADEQAARLASAASSLFRRITRPWLAMRRPSSRPQRVTCPPSLTSWPAVAVARSCPRPWTRSSAGRRGKRWWSRRRCRSWSLPTPTRSRTVTPARRPRWRPGRWEPRVRPSWPSRPRRGPPAPSRRMLPRRSRRSRPPGLSRLTHMTNGGSCAVAYSCVVWHAHPSVPLAWQHSAASLPRIFKGDRIGAVTAGSAVIPHDVQTRQF